MTEKKTIWVCCNPFVPLPINLLEDNVLTIGRHGQNTLQLQHSCVSRYHAVIKTIGNRCLTIADRGSSNGTYLNGKKISNYPRPLKMDDLIQIEPYEIAIRQTPTSEGNLDKTNTEFLAVKSKASMAGQLEKTSLVELLQGIEFNSKTGTLYIEEKSIEEKDDRDGFFVFSCGRPMSAIFGKLVNIPAMNDMLSLTKGNIVLTDKIEPFDTGIDVSITSILLDHSRHQDEKI